MKSLKTDPLSSEYVKASTVTPDSGIYVSESRLTSFANCLCNAVFPFSLNVSPSSAETPDWLPLKTASTNFASTSSLSSGYWNVMFMFPAIVTFSRLRFVSRKTAKLTCSHPGNSDTYND